MYPMRAFAPIASKRWSLNLM